MRGKVTTILRPPLDFMVSFNPLKLTIWLFYVESSIQGFEFSDRLC
jgi:hypothetical protein